MEFEACSSSLNSLHPRRYQVKVLEVAMKRNTIVVLETGAGKTMIAVMLINQVAQTFEFSGPRAKQKHLVLFLAPTVNLVIQQGQVIKDHTEFQLGEYYGSKGVDAWNNKSWEREISEHDVLVMTPQVLLDALRKAYLSLETVCLMIIDECHRATGNHPYAKIMKEFYHKSSHKPKIFGMTASPVIRKGVSSSMDSESQISELEHILDSQVFTIGDKTEIDACIPSAKETCRFYDSAQFNNSGLKAKVEFSWLKFDTSFLKLQESLESHYRDIGGKLKTLRKRLSNDQAKILYCLDELGLICAHEAVKICLENAPDITDDCKAYTGSYLQYKEFLEEVSFMFSGLLSLGSENLWDQSFDCSKAVALGFISPKLAELLQLFQSFGAAEKVLCLIFVERIVTAKVIERFVKKVKCFPHYTVSYLAGSNTSVDGLAPKLQKETLESFRSGKVNLLFATDVVEEGIHMPQCSCVVRFDLPKTVRSYIQSRGRARLFNSQFVIMVERGNMNQVNQLFDIITSEHSMMRTSVARDRDASIPKPCSFEEIKAYIVAETGASVTVDSSVSLIHRYCDKLPGDKYYVPKPIFTFSDLDSSYQCTLTLPSSAAFQTIVGPPSRNSHLAKKFVCLEACKKLHQMGALDNHLLPALEEPSENDCNVRESAPGAGTTKRKELHGTTQIHSLSGNWSENHYDTVFHSYKFDFFCNVPGELFSGFMLLTESKLADDVGNMELELYLVSKSVSSSVSYCGEVHLDVKQITQAKCFQEFFFNGLFGRLVTGRKNAEGQREFLLNSEMKSFWIQSNMYLLLPLETLNAPAHDSWVINWKGINSCTSVVEFLKKNFMLHAVQLSSGTESSWLCGTSLSDMESESNGIIRFANGSIDLNNVTEMVVVAVHSGKIYSIVEVVHGSSSGSRFDGNPKLTYSEYFNRTYGITLMYPGQPLLRLKQSHNAHNLLVDFNAEDASSCGKTSRAKKPEQHVHMPPELLINIDVPIEVIKSLYLLPSMMYRLESLMLASQLRQEINCSNLNIPSSLILEALTTLRCCESFSMERLELLGDSVIKYAVSCHLFFIYPEKHEGQLSARRSWAVCNATLHKWGTLRKLQGYIRDSPFDPRRWVAPGQRSLRPIPCTCGVDTQEVPLDSKFQTEDPKIDVGKYCDKGHRWMVSKTIADCVEALIGAYYVAGGLLAALHIMKWLGINAEIEPALVIEMITSASLRSYSPKNNEIAVLESKLGYEFSAKGLLQEAITHASEQVLGVSYCYQRLEFLGDSVLDLLITWHLYQSHTDVDPGELTDLRSASVNNENFARVAVRHNFHQHLQHCSGLLLGQISEYVNSFSGNHESNRSLESKKGPKALGDLIESIAGAILIDGNLSLDTVWRVYEPLLSPIVTPDKLELPPLRELIELCDSLGYFLKEKCVARGEMVYAELRLQLKDVLLVGEGRDRGRKAAKGTAARHLLKELEQRGISFLQNKRRKCNPPSNEDTTSNPIGEMSSKRVIKRGQEKGEPQKIPLDFSKDIAMAEGCSWEECSPSRSVPAIRPIDTRKGGPRTSLFELCKRLQWPKPSVTSTEVKSRSPIEFGEGPERRTGFSSFVSKITLHIPNYGAVECTGDPRADKKSSYDSAALIMLHELQRRGKLVIGDS